MALTRLGKRTREGKRYGWGFIDQTLSSTTNLGLSLLAGRILGPSGLGTVFLGFSSYTLAASLLSGLVTTPLVASSSALKRAAREEASSSGLTMILLWAASSTLLFVAAGIAVSGPIGEGLLLFAPWLFPALLQGYWRALLFREDRAREAALNDGLWLFTMALAAPVAVASETKWAVVACWGVGALGGAILGAAQLRLRPKSIRIGVTWWRLHASAMGRWLALQGGISYATGYVVLVMLTKFVGASSVGGLRAALTLFAPITLIGPAIALPGLPAMTRSLSTSIHAARRLAWVLSGGSSLLAGTYALAMVLLGDKLLPLFFGARFTVFRTLVWPIGTWQVMAGAALGFMILLNAQQRGLSVALAGASDSVTTTTIVPLLAWSHGLVGAAWGMACGSGAAMLASAYLAMGRRKPGKGPPHFATDEQEMPGFPGSPPP